MASIRAAAADTHPTAAFTPPRGGIQLRGRGRGGRRTRVVSRTKLPRMNNSERGKFYRQKYREYEDQLEKDVKRLQGEVHDLQRLLELRQLLPYQYPHVDLDEVRAATQVVYQGLARLHERWASIATGAEAAFHDVAASDSDETRPAEHVQVVERMRLSPSQSEQFITRHQHTATPMLFKLDSVEIAGTSDSRVVAAHGRLYVQYRPTDLEILFPIVRHNKYLAARLLAKEVAYTCTYRFHTSNPMDATDLAFASVEVDPVSGLLNTVASLHCVEALLGPMVHSDYSSVRVKSEDSTESRVHYCSDSSPPRALANLSIRGSAADHTVTAMPAAPRPMALAFILS